MYLNEETKKSLDRTFIEAFGMTYLEFSLLDFDKQQELITQYHSTHPKYKSEDARVAFGSGDSLMFVSYPKGTKVLTSNGYVIAGETREEYNQRMQQRETEVFGKIGLDEINSKNRISNSDFFMKRFFEKLNGGVFKKDICSHAGREFNGTEEEVQSELESYQQLLNNGIIDEAVKEEQGPVKRLIPSNKKTQK